MTRRTERRVPDPRPLTPDPVPSGREIIERVTTRSGEWQLQRRGGHYEIICNGVFLMATYNRESDRQLATLALQRLEGRELRVLVGGLGIGFTAQAVLEDARVGRLEVVEVEPLIGAWHQAHFGGLCGRPLDDPRTILIPSDLAALELEPGAYDAILLDTDNGPEWLARDENARLYSPLGMRRFLGALRERGVLGYWSAAQALGFEAMLRDAGALVEAIEVPEKIGPDRASTAWVYLATKGSQVSGVGGRDP